MAKEQKFPPIKAILNGKEISKEDLIEYYKNKYSKEK